MSFKATNWAWTHVLKLPEACLLSAVADEANDQGEAIVSHAYLCWKLNTSHATLSRLKKKLIERGLMHVERRPVEGFAGGRAVDLWILHLEVDGDKQPWPGQAAYKAQMRERRARYEVHDPADHAADGMNEAPSQAQGLNLRPSEGLNLRPNLETPSQTQGLNLRSSDSKVSNQTFEGLKSATEPSGAIKGIARTDLVPSYPVLSSPEEEATAGAVETGPDMTGPATTPTATTTEQAERGPSVAGVPVRLLRWKVRPVLDRVEDQVIEEMIRIVMSRYDAVRSPLGLMITAVRADDGQELIEEATARVAAASEAPWGPAWMSPDAVDREWSEMLQQTRDQETAEAARPRSCPTHNVDFVGPECPSCRADRLAGAHPAGPEPATPHTPGGGVDGAELRRRLRAQRAARVEGDR